MREGYPTNSIFQSPWWLDAVAPGSWEAVELTSAKHGLDAWLPYVVRFDSVGLKTIDMPPLTLSLGPWIREPASPSPRKQLNHYMSTLDQLVKLLPEVDLCRMSLHHSIPTALPFAQHGFCLQLAYTYRIDDLESEDDIWQQISTSRRQDIQKAQKQLEVRRSDDIDLFLRLNNLTYSRQSIKPPYTNDFVRRIHATCQANDSGAIIIAFDEHDNAHGAHFLAYDDDTTNGLMSGIDPQYRKSNAGSLLMWEALRFAAKYSDSFSFSGGTITNVEPFISSFGGTQVPYVRVVKDSLRWRSLMLARDSAQKLRAVPSRLAKVRSVHPR